MRWVWWQKVLDWLQPRFVRENGNDPSPDPFDHPIEATPEDPKAWMREMMLDHGVAAAPSRSATAPLEGGASEGMNPLGTGMTGGLSQPPIAYEAYVALLQRVYGPARRRLAEAAAKTPIFQAAYKVWEPGDSPATRNMLVHLHARIGVLMGQAYGFTPAPLGEVGQLNARYWAYAHYRPAQQRINWSVELYAQPVETVIEALIHEQVHRLQHERILQARSGRLGPDEALLAQCWSATYWYAGSDVDPDYHATDTARAVLSALRAAYGLSRGAEQAGPMGRDVRG